MTRSFVPKPRLLLALAAMFMCAIAVCSSFFGSYYLRDMVGQRQTIASLEDPAWQRKLGEGGLTEDEPTAARHKQLMAENEQLAAQNEQLVAEIQALKRQLQVQTLPLNRQTQGNEGNGTGSDVNKEVSKSDSDGNKKTKESEKVLDVVSDNNADSNHSDLQNHTATSMVFRKHAKEIAWRVKQTTDYDPHNKCKLSVRLLVDKPYTPPSSIECSNAWYYCPLIRHVFSASSSKGKPRILPYNVSIGFNLNDKISQGHFGQCIGSSAPNGQFSMNNFHDIKAHVETLLRFQKNANHGDNDNDNDNDPKQLALSGYSHNFTMPWEDRYPIPIFRGHPRYIVRNEWQKRPNETCVDVKVEDLGHRTQAALWSIDHPELLDAMVSDTRHPCSIYTSTNGMDRLFLRGQYDQQRNDTAYTAVFNRRPQRIPSSEYYTNYQVVVVLGGIGAAFRTVQHMSAGQAVVLQRFRYEEWFVPFMEPYVHYIPLQEDLSDLYNVTTWIRDNPKKVKKIADAGKLFYNEYLTFAKNEEHWYEVIYHLSFATHSHPNVNGNKDDVWEGKKYERYVLRNNQYDLLTTAR